MYETAWKYLDKAHVVELQNRNEPYDEESVALQTTQLKSIFTPSFWPSGVGMKTRTPIFIVGMMR